MRLTSSLACCLVIPLAISLTFSSRRSVQIRSLDERDAQSEPRELAEVLTGPLSERDDVGLFSYLAKRRGGGGSGGGGDEVVDHPPRVPLHPAPHPLVLHLLALLALPRVGVQARVGAVERLVDRGTQALLVSPSYGGGRYFGGGSTTPYRSGARTPGGLVPFVLVGGAIGAAAIFPGLWLYGAYSYNWNHPYSFRNRTNTTSNRNESLPVTCLCQQYSACGCDDNNDNSYLDSVIGNGSFNGLNKTLVNVANVNGTKTVVLNGTLPNGTDTTASSSSSSSSSTSGASSLVVGESAGLWALGAFVGGMLWML